MSVNNNAKIEIGSDQAAQASGSQKRKPNIQGAPTPCSFNKTSLSIGKINKSLVVAKMQVNRPQKNQPVKNNIKNIAKNRVPRTELVPQRPEAPQLHEEDNREANLPNEAAREAPREAANCEIAEDANRRLPIAVVEEEQLEEIVNSEAPQRHEEDNRQANLPNVAPREAANCEIVEDACPRLPVVVAEEEQLEEFVDSSSIVRPRRTQSFAQRHGNTNFNCYICKYNVRNAVITVCGHLYCWPCLWAFERTRIECTSCPHCQRTVLLHEDVVPYFGAHNGEDEDTIVTEEGYTVARPSAFRIKTSAQGCPWFLTDPSIPREINSITRRRQANFTNPYNGNTSLTRLYNLLNNFQIFLVFLTILALKFL